MWRNRITIFHWILLASAGLAAAVWMFTEGALRWLLLSAVCSIAGLWIGLGVSFPRLQVFGRSLCAFRTTRKAVALTFDDGPDPATTAAVLDVLARNSARGTFFCVGHKERQHPELVRRILNEGHQVENHSYSHSHWMNLFSVNRLIADVGQAQAATAALTGRKPGFFRPPMGLTNLRIFKAAKALELQVTGYTARAFDHRADSPEKIAQRLLRKLQPGAILLLHDGGVPAQRATAVLERILDQARRAGFECVTMDELSAEEAHQGRPAGAAPKDPHNSTGAGL